MTLGAPYLVQTRSYVQHRDHVCAVAQATLDALQAQQHEPHVIADALTEALCRVLGMHYAQDELPGILRLIHGVMHVRCIQLSAPTAERPS